MKIPTEEGWMITIDRQGLNVYFYNDDQYVDYIRKFEMDSLIIRKKVREYFKSKGIKSKLFRQRSG
jgi:hypothetical protein